MLIDEFLEDLVDLGREPLDLDNSFIGMYLPDQFRARYNGLFVKKLLVCLITVVWKLDQPGQWPLACTGEQLALRALIERAEMHLEHEGREADFGDFIELAFQDTDLDMLFNPAFDGIEDSDIADYLGARTLHPDRWFEHFYSEIPVHPCVR